MTEVPQRPDEFSEVWETFTEQTGVGDGVEEPTRRISAPEPDSSESLDADAPLPRLPSLVGEMDVDPVPEIAVKHELGRGGMGRVDLASVRNSAPRTTP